MTIKTAVLLDKKFGPLGELGIDIIIDETGRPWLLEANGNPGKIPVFSQKEFPNWPAKIYELPLEYAFHLAGFN